MYKSIEDFKMDWGYEHESTVKLFQALTDSSLQQKATPEGRSLGSLAWHITKTLGEMSGKAGLAVNAPHEESSMPGSANEILRQYDIAGKSLIAELTEKWNDSMLPEQIEMYGEQWTRSQTLNALLKHQIHHRAQMTILMRMAGLKVPGIYGPSREEWGQYGMSAPE